MKITSKPLDEEMRLQDLFNYEILDSESEKEFDELVELAAQICNCPVSLISFIDQDRQWFKAKIGIELQSTSRDVAFCAHTILQDEVMMVEDATKDLRFVENPLVLDGLVRFYAGAPIVSPNGHNLGTLCVINDSPKKLTKKQLNALNILSNQISKLLELRIKNKKIKQRTDRLIDQKNKSVLNTINDHESQKQEIAEELHEKLAQQIAVCRLYNGLAAESEEMRLSYLKKTDELLEKTVFDLQNLSKSISSSGLLIIPFEDLLEDYLKQVRSYLPFKIAIPREAKSVLVPIMQSLHLRFIVEKWINVLKNHKDINCVSIRLLVKDKIILSIEDDGDTQDFKIVENEIINSLIDTRTNSVGGIVKHHQILPKGNIIEIELPM